MSRIPTEGNQFRRYLDAASALPPSPRVSQALLSATNTAWADPGKRYRPARTSGRVLATSRASVAGAIGCPPENVAFTAGSADDAVARCLRAAVQTLTERSEIHRIHIHVSPVETLGVLRAVDAVAERVGSGPSVLVRPLPVDAYGRVNLNLVSDDLRSTPGIVVLQTANGDLGTRQPVAELSRAVPVGSILITDARHTLGHDPKVPQADYLVAGAQHWGGVAGVSVVASRTGRRLGGQSVPTDGPLGIEPTTVPVPSIAASAIALEEALADIEAGATRQRDLSDHLRERLFREVPGTRILGHPTERLAHINMFTFLYVAADELVDELDRRGWSVASGSSCSSETRRPLHVLEAIGAMTHGNLRVSLTPWTVGEDLDAFVEDLADVVEGIRRDSEVLDLL